VADLFTPGRLWQRLAFAVLLPLAIWAIYGWWTASLHGAVATVLGVAAFMTGVLSSAAVFRAWTAFGERLNQVVVRFLFGVIYFGVVPVFLLARLRDRLGVRGAHKRESFWLGRPPVEESAERMARMG